jgi:hypothetical protein
VGIKLAHQLRKETRLFGRVLTIKVGTGSRWSMLVVIRPVHPQRAEAKLTGMEAISAEYTLLRPNELAVISEFKDQWDNAKNTNPDPIRSFTIPKRHRAREAARLSKFTTAASVQPPNMALVTVTLQSSKHPGITTKVEITSTKRSIMPAITITRILTSTTAT